MSEQEQLPRLSVPMTYKAAGQLEELRQAHSGESIATIICTAIGVLHWVDRHIGQGRAVESRGYGETWSISFTKQWREGSRRFWRKSEEEFDD